MKYKRAKSIGVILLIIIAIGAIYLMKNNTENQSTQPLFSGDSEMAELKDADFSLESTEMIDYEALSKYGLPIIVDYGSDSCIPCKEMAPVLKTMNSETQGKAFIKFVDVWKYDAAENVPVQVIPTQVLVNADGSPFLPSDELASQIEFTMYSSKDTNEHIFTTHQGGLTEEQMRAILAEMGVAQ